MEGHQHPVTIVHGHAARTFLLHVDASVHGHAVHPVYLPARPADDERVHDRRLAKAGFIGCPAT